MFDYEVCPKNHIFVMPLNYTEWMAGCFAQDLDGQIYNTFDRQLSASGTLLLGWIFCQGFGKLEFFENVFQKCMRCQRKNRREPQMQQV
jgi:hypothetical protein